MADRSDESKKEFSIEELNTWNVEKLRKYLKNRGVVITSRILVNATWFRKFTMLVV